MGRLTAITRAVSSRLAECDLGFLEREPIDASRARAQHDAYERCLAELGVHVVAAEPEPELPDSVFVEDPAMVLDEVAVMTRMQSERRRRESASLEAAVARFRPVRRLRAPATLEGGDVLRVGRKLYAGLSKRTSSEGVRQLAEELAPFGYQVQAVAVDGCLHLKSACCYLGRDTLIANPDWVDPTLFPDLRILPVAPGEAAAANVLAAGDGLIIPANFPATAEMLEREGFRVLRVDVSELQKAEAGVTCCSLIFEA